MPGSPEAVAEAVADLWWERRIEHAADPGYSLSVSAPTNADALMLARAIRARRRTAGELAGPDHLVAATDNVGRKFEVTLAVSDKVRLYARTPARSSSGQTLEIGVNGSVLEIEAIEPDGPQPGGIRLRDASGRSGLVAWTTLLHPEGDPAEPRYRLGYGDVLTIDSIQGVTTEESIFVMPNGSDRVDAFRGYTAASRHRAQSYVIVGEAAERAAIAVRRPIGARRPVTEDEIWDRVAANLSREPVTMTATVLVARARAVQAEVRRTLPLTLAPAKACARRGLTRANLRRGFERSREVAALTDWAEVIGEPISRQLAETAGLAQMLSRRKDGVVPGKGTAEPEPGGFAQGRILRHLELWAKGVGEWIARQLMQTRDLALGLSDPARDVMMKPGRLAQQFGRRRDLDCLDGWARSLTEGLGLQLQTSHAILAATSKGASDEPAGPVAEPIPSPIETPVEPDETGWRRKSAKRARAGRRRAGREM